MNQILFTITTKEKIKRVRLHRHMKQRELGELVGFTDGAATRIAQYESGFHVPKEDMVKNSSGAPSRGMRAARAGYRQSGRYYGSIVLRIR